jgi:hypothetical protein
MTNSLPAKRTTAAERLQALARSASTTPLLKYNSGNWTIDDVPVPPDTKFVCHCDQVAHAWTHFYGEKWIAEVAAVVAEDDEGDTEQRIVKGQGREDLPDRDESLWELDKSGKKKDPWSYGFALPMTNAATGAAVVFKTSSAGGRGAIAERVGDFQRSQRLGYPIVVLASGSYRNKKFGGYTSVPILRVVDYDAPPTVPVNGGDGSRVIGESKVADRNADMDDDIPF